MNAICGEYCLYECGEFCPMNAICGEYHLDECYMWLVPS